MLTFRVVWSRHVDKALEALPSYLRDKFLAWVLVIERVGLLEARKRPGYHDEPLQGARRGQRSVRLNRAYRVIYAVRVDDRVQIVEVQEISKHVY